MAWKRPNIVELILQDPMKLSTYLRVPVEDLPYDEGVSVWNRRGRIRSMYGRTEQPRVPLPEVVGASKAAPLRGTLSASMPWLRRRWTI